MHLLDIRVAERNMEKGLLNRKKYAKYLKDLPDVTDKSEPISEPQPLEPETQDGEAEA
jgi:hypothetical protein